MKYNFEILVTVSFKHSYFSNEIFGGLSVEPSAASLQIFLNNGLLFKPFNGGFRILYDTGFAGTERSREDALNPAMDCSFMLTLTDRDFYNYTASSGGDISKSMYYFKNTAEEGSELKKSLHAGQSVTSEDLRPLADFDEKYFTRPFGRIDLRLADGLENNYSITFSAKETYWRYILMNEALQSLNSPAIIDSTGSEFFDGPEKLPVRGREAISFRSKSPISFQQNIQQIFQLVDNYDAATGRYKVIMRALPSADPAYITLINTDKNIQQTNYSEIFIH